MRKVALITGVTGQDGAYLSEFLLKKGYMVYGLKRRASRFNTDRVDHLYRDPHVEHQNFMLHYGPESDRGIRFNDPSLGIDWKVPLTELKLAPKDVKRPHLKDTDYF